MNKEYVYKKINEITIEELPMLLHHETIEVVTERVYYDVGVYPEQSYFQYVIDIENQPLHRVRAYIEKGIILEKEN